MAERKDPKAKNANKEAIHITSAAEAQSVPFYRRPVLWAVVAVVAFLAIYLLRLDQAVGMIVDDAWYVLLAKALATGQGYRIINAPGAQIMPLYPPGFPFLLSLVFRVAPSFPENYWLLKSVSIAAMLGVGVLTFVYLRRLGGLSDGLALLLAFVVASAPPLAFLATSTVMSECVFTLAQLGVIWLAERVARAQAAQQAYRAAFLCGAVAAGAFLIRSLGVALLLAGLIYFAKERLFRPALVYLFTLVLCVSPWLVYSRLHAPTPEQRREHGGHIVEPYTEQFWQSLPGDRFSAKESIPDLPGRVWKNILLMAGDSAGELLATEFHYLLKQVGTGASWLSWPISLLLLWGYVRIARKRLGMAEIVVPASLALALLWPWPPARLLLPLLPLLVFYFFTGLCALSGFFDRSKSAARVAGSRDGSRKIMPAAAVLLLAINCYGNGKYFVTKYGKSGDAWKHGFDEYKAMLDWMRNRLPAEGETAIATNNPPLVYLYTGHKSVTLEAISENWESWKRLGVRYYVPLPLNKPGPLPPPDMNEGRFNVIYRSTGPRQLRVVDLGPAATRRPWNRFSQEKGIKFETFN